LAARAARIPIRRGFIFFLWQLAHQLDVRKTIVEGRPQPSRGPPEAASEPPRGLEFVERTIHHGSERRPFDLQPANEARGI